MNSNNDNSIKRGSPLVFTKLIVIKYDIKFFLKYVELSKECLEKEYPDYRDLRNEIGSMGEPIAMIFWQDTFRNFYYYSFIRLFALFEDTLINICRAIREDGKGIELEVTDLKGSNFTKTKKYISDYSDFEFPRNSNYWRELMDFKRVRNLILHCGGEIRKGDNNINRIISDYSELEEGRLEYKVAFSMDFIIRVADTIKLFFKEFAKRNSDVFKQ